MQAEEICSRARTSAYIEAVDFVILGRVITSRVECAAATWWICVHVTTTYKRVLIVIALNKKHVFCFAKVQASLYRGQRTKSGTEYATGLEVQERVVGATCKTCSKTR